jgi:hypothetical protein
VGSAHDAATRALRSGSARVRCTPLRSGVASLAGAGRHGGRCLLFAHTLRDQLEWAWGQRNERFFPRVRRTCSVDWTSIESHCGRRDTGRDPRSGCHEPISPFRVVTDDRIHVDKFTPTPTNPLIVCTLPESWRSTASASRRRSLPRRIHIIDVQTGRERPHPLDRNSVPGPIRGVAHVLSACVAAHVPALREPPLRCVTCEARSHTPARCRSRRRRQHVIPDPHPSSCGSICQGILLRRTKTMPVRHARSHTRGPPPCGRREGIGKNGSTRSLNGSASRAAMPVHATSSTTINFRRFCYTLFSWSRTNVSIDHTA